MGPGVLPITSKRKRARAGAAGRRPPGVAGAERRWLQIQIIGAKRRRAFEAGQPSLGARPLSALRRALAPMEELVARRSRTTGHVVVGFRWA